jgi:hypothetical protein
MNRKTPTRIELHRLKFHASGRVIGLIPFDRLDQEEKKIVAQDILTNIYTTGEDPYKVYAEVLNSWGVMCPHPQHMRSYNGKSSLYPIREVRWYKCLMCHCSIINDEFGDTQTTRPIKTHGL